MKTGEKLSKIVSTSIALILCSAVLAFALTALCWGAALPAYAHAACTPSSSFLVNPSQGPVDTAVTVTGTGVSNQIYTANFPCPPLPRGTNVSIGIGTACGGSLNPVGSTTIDPTVGSFTDSFHWPKTGTGSTAGSYQVCVTAGSNAPTSAGTFTVTTTATATVTPTVTATVTATVTPTVTATATTTASGSVSVDSSSYKVGDNMTVTGTGFPHSTSVTVKLQSSNGATTTTLGNVTTDTTGAFTQDYTVPAHPLNSVVVIVTYGSSQQATSGSFTVKAKSSSSSSSTHTPAPAPTSPPPPPTTYYPPAALAATPTPVPTATPTPVPTATDTPTPVPTVAPIPTQVPVVATHTTSLFGNLLDGKLPLVLAIGLGTLIGLSLLFVVGRVLLGKFLSPSPAPTISPSGTSPWLGSQGNSLQGNTMLNGAPLGQTMPFDSSFPPGNGGFAPGYGPPQQVPFNSPFGSGNGEFAPVPGNGPFQPADGGFAPGPGNSPQPVPMGGPYQPSTSGFAPANANEQEPLPPNNWFGSPN